MDAIQDASNTGAYRKTGKANSGGRLAAAFQSASNLQMPWERRWQALGSRSTVHKPYGHGVDSSMWNSLDHTTVLYGLIAANISVWFLWQSPERREFMEKHFQVSVASIEDRREHTAVTANFSHSDAGHLALNMLALHSFGRMIGHPRLFGGGGLLALYLAGGLGCVAGHCLYWSYFVPWKQGVDRRAYNARRTPSALGASGSVSALLTCSILLNPSQKLLVYGLPVPAWLYGIFVTALDLSGAIGVNHGSRIGYAGHLGGAAVGAAAWLLFRRCS
ncbi:hypothetical protein KFL_001900220 [Klebsormidium nitens]|uniref:Peptidase S54 rhomboid domain-containing protein n=1 Tax=Klebsormidium nitens TaxID=105231 RepID=A0A1Y1I4Y3_KLENI|nr:hypothetical protein KFL_001900220 [Klebsormidium nitens]|eukprot:GAQ84479.1 hypothetical protein KFL_001900220 [Klebsormidium nitens]